MGIMISYLVGVLFIIFPKLFSPIIANITYQLTRHAWPGLFGKRTQQERYDEAHEDQMKVGPKFTIFLGVFIILLTFFIQSNKA